MIFEKVGLIIWGYEKIADIGSRVPKVKESPWDLNIALHHVPLCNKISRINIKVGIAENCNCL